MSDIASEDNRDSIFLHKLEKIEKDVAEIKKHMVDVDSIMTEEDYEALLKFRKEKSSGKLISHEQLKRELGL
ncbi:MAG: hypothetical protein IBX39_10465 [Candidatus Methanoperedenaceae archaeon]|nr:hypothetical protein [Candidatus Methanoperedenaceae archaeon]